MEVREVHEQIHEAGHGGHHGHHEATDHEKVVRNRRVAVLISVLAAVLAIIEMGGKSSQNTSLAANIEAANLWSFFQAKTIRMTTMRTAAEALEAVQPDLAPPQAEKWGKRVADWRSTAARYDTEPETGEGRKELAARAKQAEERRDRSLAAYHMFEYGAAALQIAIVLASASVVTGMVALALAGGGLGLLGLAFGMLGWFAPTLLHL